MNVRVPFYAPVIPPDIGESTNTNPFFLASPANSFEATGDMVLVSTMIVPFLAL
jgi:hypothetical protein